MNTPAAPAVNAGFGAGQMDDSSDLKTIKQTTAANQSSIATMQIQLQSLQDDLKQLQQAQQGLAETMVNVSEGISQINNTLKPKKAVKVAPIVPIVFNLRAIVPGRAWLVDSNGQTRTVQVGDTLSQYGKVQQILPEQGQVTTSSGKVIEFGDNNA